MRRLATCTVILMTFLAVGCGTMAADYRFTFNGDGKVTASVAVKVTGALANLMAGDSDPIAGYDRDIWEVQKDQQGDDLILSASTKHPLTPEELGKAYPESGSIGANQVGRNMRWTTSGSPFVRTHKVVLDIPPSPAPTELTQTSGLIDQKQLAALVDTTIKFSVAITMPEEITATNADSKSGQTATWLFSLSSFTEGKNLEVESREVVWPAIGGAAFVLAGLAGGGLWVVRRRLLTNSTRASTIGSIQSQPEEQQNSR